MLRERFNTEMKQALKDRDQETVAAIRLIIAKLKEVDIAARPKGVTAVPDEEVLAMMQGMIKQRRESIALYEQGNRPELAAKEAVEIAVIERFLPQQMDDAATSAAIAAVVAELGASSIKDMGKVMAELKARHTGVMDFAKASPMVKAQLGG